MPNTQSQQTKPHFRRERSLASKGIWPVAGIDEAGRGPLAGPVAAAAVVLDPRNLPKGLNDSKVLSADIREVLFDDIMRRAVAVTVAFSSAAEIDRINIRQATLSAMRRALAGLSVSPSFVFVDGNDLPANLVCQGETIVAGDASCLSIAAASIIAKVTRDRMMRRLCQHHPQYGFSQHFGYATKAHRAAIERHGPSPFHRLTFSPFRIEPIQTELALQLPAKK
jgi:ribonuclease HII